MSLCESNGIDRPPVVGPEAGVSLPRRDARVTASGRFRLTPSPACSCPRASTPRRPCSGEMDQGVFEQVTNVACLPGIVRASLCMPDGHWGYGFPIGGVAAFNADTGVISPGGIGFDINCGMRLLRTALTEDDVRPRLRELVDALFTAVPSGVGAHGNRSPMPTVYQKILVAVDGSNTSVAVLAAAVALARALSGRLAGSFTWSILHMTIRTPCDGRVPGDREELRARHGTRPGRKCSTGRWRRHARADDEPEPGLIEGNGAHISQDIVERRSDVGRRPHRGRHERSSRAQSAAAGQRGRRRGARGDGPSAAGPASRSRRGMTTAPHPATVNAPGRATELVR